MPQQPTALVTGASRGLGRALAADLAADGWRVVVDARHGDALAEAVAGLPGVVDVPGDVADPAHRTALAEAVDDLGGLDLLVLNASLLGPSPQPRLADYPLDVLEQVYRVNVLAPLALIQLAHAQTTINVTSDASVEAYEGWGGYGSAKAALDHLTAILAAEQPDRRFYAVDPGDMNTRLHQEAFPGEDISDRPPPEDSVPGLLALIEGDHPSGRYQAKALVTV